MEMTRDKELLVNKILNHVSRVTKTTPPELREGSTPGHQFEIRVKKGKAAAVTALKFYGLTHTQASQIVGLKGPNVSNLCKWYKQNVDYFERRAIHLKIAQSLIK